MTPPNEITYPKLKPLTIESKEDYLAWVAHWKATYRALARLIREAKKRKRYHRDQARLTPCANESREFHRSQMWDAHTLARGGRWRAADMMEWRRAGKEQSWAARCKLLGEKNLHDQDASQEDIAAA